MKVLVTGVTSGLGKFLYENISNSHGLHRNNFDEIENEYYDIIIHCAFNKEQEITNYKKYLEDNIFLTQKLKKLKHQKFVYISSIDVYNLKENTYSLFKKLAESMMDRRDLILRCSTIVGPTMKINHLEKLRKNQNLNLSKNSTFRYILMKDILEFVTNFDIWNCSGAIDFIPNDSLKINEVSNLFKSKSTFGEFEYNSDYLFKRPIYDIFKYFNNTSIKNLNRYYG